MQVVVTGARGFLGERVVHMLRASQVQVIAVSRGGGPDIHVVGDYRQTPAGDVLVHLAEDGDRARVNAAGIAYEQAAEETLRALLAKGFGRVVYASSAVLYGDKSERPHRATDPLEIVDGYTRAKLAGEVAVLGHGNGVVARLANLYGPRMSANNVLSTILGQIVEGNEVIKIWDDSPIRDFLWVDDAADCIARMACGKATGTFNLGSGESVSIAALADILFASSGKPGLRLDVTRPSAHRSILKLDCEETRRVWNWRSATELRKGLQTLLQQRKLQR